MVHRTDIAGGSTGQTCPGNDRMCRHALNGALPDNNPLPELLPVSQTASSVAVFSRRRSRRSIHLSRTADPV